MLLMKMQSVLLVAALFTIVSSQSCVPAKKINFAEIVVKSPIVVLARIDTSNVTQKVYNATAHVERVFATRNGSMSKGSLSQFGPLGKRKDCFTVKNTDATYILFLNNALSDGFSWIKFNPIRANSKTIRSLEKLLCNGCLRAPLIKRSGKVFKKSEGKRLKMRCKASGNPRPVMSWYHNGTLLTKSNTPTDIIIRSRKKGGSSTLQIEKLDRKYDETEFVCSASNPVSPTAVNFTAVVIISRFLGGVPCSMSCTAADANYCVEGMCCRDAKHRYCRCYDGWMGHRCDDKDYSRAYFQKPLEYRHMQRLVAVLGMCLALMLVVFLCFAVYCFFKRSRNDMHKKLLHNQSGSNSSSNLITNDSHTVTDGITATTPLTADAEIVETNHIPLEKRLSRNSMNGGSKRGRLGGLAKNESRSSSAKRLASSPTNSPLPIRTLPKPSSGANSVTYHTESFASELSTHTQREVPEMPLASGLTNLVNHLPGNVSVTNSPKFTENRSPNNRTVVDGREPFELALKASNLKNHTVTTFGPDGNVQEENIMFDREDGSLIVTSQGSLSSPESFHRDAPLSSSESVKMPSQHQNNQNANNNTGGVEEASYSVHASTSDQEDLFVGVDIPDMSLSLYSNTPDHSMKKTKLYHQNAVNSDDIYTPHSPTNFSVSSAERHRLPLVSRDGDSESDDSVSSQLSDYENSSESNSHKILV